MQCLSGSLVRKRYWFWLLLLTGCSRHPPYTPLQQVVRRYIQTQEPDSAQYAPLWFSEPTAFTRADSLRPTVTQYTTRAERIVERLRTCDSLIAWQTYHRAPAAELAKATQQDDSLLWTYKSLMDTRLLLLRMSTKQVLGQQLTHSWRIGERVDSARFAIFYKGTVQRLPSRTAVE